MSDELAVPTLHLTADATLSRRPQPRLRATIAIASGHVGMIVGSARAQLYNALKEFLQ